MSHAGQGLEFMNFFPCVFVLSALIRMTYISAPRNLEISPSCLTAFFSAWILKSEYPDPMLRFPFLLKASAKTFPLLTITATCTVCRFLSYLYRFVVRSSSRNCSMSVLCGILSLIKGGEREFSFLAEREGTHLLIASCTSIFTSQMPICLPLYVYVFL